MPSPSLASRSAEGGAEGSAATLPSARAAAEIIAVTTRDDFLLELGEVVSGQAAVRPVDSLSTALTEVVGSRKVQLLAVDARDVEDLRAGVERINNQAPHVVTLVFADADAEKQVAFALKGTSVFAVLCVPMDKRKTAAVLEGAIADASTHRAKSAAPAGDLRLDRTASITVEPAHTASVTSSAPAEVDSGNRKPGLLIGVIVAALIAGGAAFWYFTRPVAPVTPVAGKKATISIESDNATVTDVDAATAPEPIKVDMPLVDAPVDELLEKARAAMRERHYTDPAGNNALLYYLSAKKQDPTNGEALDGLKRVAGVLSGRFDEAMSANRYDEAALALAQLKVATPDEPDVKTMEGRLATAQITRMLADGNLDRAASILKGAQQSGAVPDAQIAKWRAEINRRLDEARQKKLVDLAEDRIRAGRFSGSDDSAEAYLRQLRDMGPSAAASQQRVARELGNAYMRKAREAALAGRGSEADRWLAEARSVGVSSSELRDFQRDIASAKQRAAAAESERLANEARERLKAGKLVEPANDSAAYYLAALQAADKDHPYVAAGSRELAAKLLERASAEAREGKTAQMEADLAQARRWGADAKDIQAVQQASLNRKSGKSSGSSSAQRQDLAAKLKRTRYVAPEYPDRALNQRITGFVTVEFTVSKEGEPLDVHVVASDPAGTFDRAALSAVRRWRYEPVLVNNEPQEVPARTTIRFTLPDQ